MRLVVDHDELQNVLVTVDDDTKYINEQIDYLLKQIDDLKDIWTGEDAEKFYEKAEAYLRYIKAVPQVCDNLSRLSGSANGYYKKTDKIYAESMKRAVVRHE